MRIVFIGASGFGLRCLGEIAQLSSCDVVGAVTNPRNFSISYRPAGVTNVLYADVGTWCEMQGVPCITMASTMNEPGLLDQVRAWRPDCFLVVGWYHMVPAAWRDLAPAFGMHASLLPDYSGGAPLVWAIINGEQHTGITLFRLDAGVDDGPMLGQASTPILPEDTIATLYARIEELGVTLLREHLPRLADGSAILLPQDERGRRIFPQRAPHDGNIDWSLPAYRIRDFVRAQTHPYPGAFSHFRGKQVWIWQAALSTGPAPQLAPGELAWQGATLWVGCGQDGVLQLHVLGEAGEHLPAERWVEMRGLSAGERLLP